LINPEISPGAARPAPILVRYGEEVANLVEELAKKIGARGR